MISATALGPGSVMGVPLILISGYEDLTKTEVEELRDKGVCLDDWDYMLVGPSSIVKKEWREGENWETGEMKMVCEFVPDSWTLERLLTGCYKNTWYQVEFRGKLVAIGVAYHS